MKIHYQEIFKRNVQFLIFIGMAIFCFISLVFSIKAISVSKRPLIIGIDSNGTRVVTDKNDPIYKSEAMTFLKMYLFNVYNFNASNFVQRVGAATSFMSDELWNKKGSEIISLQDKVNRDGIELKGEIQKMSSDGDFYYALVEVKEKSRVQEREYKIKVKVGIKSSSRSFNSPTGLEVDIYEETPLK